jgi:hypothetical protein
MLVMTSTSHDTVDTMRRRMIWARVYDFCSWFGLTVTCQVPAPTGSRYYREAIRTSLSMRLNMLSNFARHVVLSTMLLSSRGCCSSAVVREEENAPRRS